MVDPRNRQFAEAFNKREFGYLKKTEFELRMHFIDVAIENVQDAIRLYQMQKESIIGANTGNYTVYNFAGEFLPTSEDDSDNFITQATVGCLMVSAIPDNSDEPDEKLEIRVPVNDDFDIDNLEDLDNLSQSRQVYLKHEKIHDTGEHEVHYYFVWQGGVGRYDPLSDEPEEHEIEFQFFIENVEKLDLHDFTAAEIINWNFLLVKMHMWYYSSTEINIDDPKIA